MNLVLTITNLNCGGAERVLSLLANHWVSRGAKITLVMLASGTPFFPLDPRVELVALGLNKVSRNPWQALSSLFRTRGALRKVLKDKKPDAVIAFTTRVNVKVLMAAQGLGIPVVISERNDPRAKPLGRRWTLLRDRWYRRAHRLVVQTPVVDQWFRDRGYDKLTIIANPVEASPSMRLRSEGTGAPLVLNVARLMPQKGQELLVRAVASLKRQDVRLRILGDGPERERLTALAQQLGMGSRLELPGFVAEKGPHFDEASLFVLSSLYEGFPNALVEAMAEGLPCVSFDCPSGPAELIHDGENGLLVPAGDVEALSQAIEKVLDDPAAARAWGHSARKVVEELGVETIAHQWEAALS